MMKCLRRQNITYSLLHQIIKQTGASYGILQGSGGTGDKQEKKSAYFMKKYNSLLSPLCCCCCESIQLLLQQQAKKEEITESLRTRRRMVCTTDMKASLRFRRTKCFHTARAVLNEYTVCKPQLGFEKSPLNAVQLKTGCEVPFVHVDHHHLGHHLDH